MTLNYSREDLEVLLSQAERLVCSNNGANLREKESVDSSSDSDYETKASRDWLVSSEPNIPLRRLSPARKSRRDWRNSLPECLEYFNHDKAQSEDGRESQASLPLSELWEHDSFLSEHFQDGPLENEKATLPPNLANFGEDYHSFLYSDETESDGSDLEEERGRGRHSNTNYQILQSKSCLKDLLIQLNTNDDLWKSYKELEEIEEVCQKNISSLTNQRRLTDVKHQLKSFERLICKWEDVSSDVRKGLQQQSELRDISEKIDIVTGDLATLDSIISDDYEDEFDDDEVADIKHQLFEQAKSHLLEISDSLFQLNLSLVTLRTGQFSQFPLRSLDVAEVERELGRVYAAWQETHGKVSQAENRNQEREVCRHQEQFSDLVSHRLSRLIRTEEFVSSDKHGDNQNPREEEKPASTLSRLLRFGLVSSVMVVSVLSVSAYLWTHNKCEHNYYNQIWPVLSFSAGPRPY